MVEVHVVSSQKLTADSYDIQWDGISNFADNSSLPVGLPSCGGGVCDNQSNLTAGVFTARQDVNVSLSGTVIINGTTYNLENEQVEGGSFVVDGTSVSYEITGDVSTCNVMNAGTQASGVNGVAVIAGGATVGEEVFVLD